MYSMLYSNFEYKNVSNQIYNSLWKEKENKEVLEYIYSWLCDLLKEKFSEINLIKQSTIFKDENEEYIENIQYDINCTKNLLNNIKMD